jgi:hypothetical protein
MNTSQKLSLKGNSKVTVNPLSGKADLIKKTEGKIN